MGDSQQMKATKFRAIFLDILNRMDDSTTSGHDVLQELADVAEQHGLDPVDYADSAALYSPLLRDSMPARVLVPLIERVGVLGRHAHAAAHDLVSFLEHDDDDIVKCAVVALCKIKSTEDAILSALDALMRDESRSSQLRSYAAHTLRSLTQDSRYQEYLYSIPDRVRVFSVGLCPVDDPRYEQVSIVIGGGRPKR
jgi:hypothetical protein